MKVKFGAIVTEARGKINGFVASRNRGGAYFRTKVTPVNVSNVYTAAVRSRLAGLSSAWRGLTAAQRISWNAAVVDFAKTNIFGDLVKPSGFNLFQSINNNLVTIGESALDSPPTPQAVANVLSLSIAADNSDQTLIATFADAIAATEKVKVFATPAMSPGKSFVKSEFRLIDVLTSADASPAALTTSYLSKFGAIGEVGQKIFVKFVPVSVASGQEGIGVIASTIIVA